MKKMTKRIKDRRGFTVAELLITILILLMVTGVVAAGIPVAAEAYYKVVDTANAQLLLSTTVTTLRTQLETAQSVKIDESTKDLVYYTSQATATTSIESTETGIMFQPYMLAESDGTYKPTATYTRPLVTASTATNNLHTEYESLKYDPVKKLFTVTKLQVIRTVNGESNVIAQLDVFTVRAVNVR